MKTMEGYQPEVGSYNEDTEDSGGLNNLIGHVH